MEMILKELKNELSYQIRLDAINKIKEVIKLKTNPDIK